MHTSDCGNLQQDYWVTILWVVCVFFKLLMTRLQSKAEALQHNWKGNVLCVHSVHRTTSLFHPSERPQAHLLPENQQTSIEERLPHTFWITILPSFMFSSSSRSDVKLYIALHLPIEQNSAPETQIHPWLYQSVIVQSSFQNNMKYCGLNTQLSKNNNMPWALPSKDSDGLPLTALICSSPVFCWTSVESSSTGLRLVGTLFAGLLYVTELLIDWRDLNGVFLILTGRESCTTLCSQSWNNPGFNKAGDSEIITGVGKPSSPCLSIWW